MKLPGGLPGRGMLFQNVTLILPDRLAPGGSLRTRGERIEAVATDGEPLPPTLDEEVIDGAGAYLAPGFVDLHVHGAARRDTMEGSADAFHQILHFHARGGTTAATLTTTAATPEEILRVLSVARHWLAQDSTAPAAALLLGIHLEGPYFAPGKAGAHRRELLRVPTEAEVDQFLGFSDVITQMTLAPELPGALPLIGALRERGIIASGGHSDAWEEEAAAAHARGMSRVTHVFNAMSSARRRGPFRVAGLLEYALATPEIHCELIADGRHVSPTLMRMLYRAKGPAAICLITDASAGAGLPDGTLYRLAGSDCVVRDGVGLTADGTALAGSASTMIAGVRCLVQNVGVPLEQAVGMATSNPARALRRAHERGRLAVGLRSDLVLISPSLEIVATYVGGARVYPA